MERTYTEEELGKIARNLDYRNFRNDEFWKEIPAWKDVTREEFGNHKWQMKNSIARIEQVQKILGDRISEEFMEDLRAAQKVTPMNIRITPYVFALINWDDPENDPLRKQFLPIGTQQLEDHPFYLSDSLAEDEDSPVPQLTHRYPDKVLFLPLAICPVYCAYCTRSRLIGGSTETVQKETYGINMKNWEKVFDYIKNTPVVEDVIISGGDVSMLGPKFIRQIGEALLDIPNVRRIRYATKAVSIYPQKFITDTDWMDALRDVYQKGRELGKQVMVHTHFSSPNEVTEWSKMAMDKLFEIGVTVRNQAVLQEGVNNDPGTMITLTKQLSYMNIQPYYVFIHDMVPGCENLRTTLADALELDKAVRGTTAGFNLPTFICDLPGGGGKRNAYSYEYYDRENGISVWKAPSVKPGKIFTYFDPIHSLSEEAKKRWADPATRDQMLKDAIAKVK